MGRKGRKKEAENDRTITVEGDHHHIRVFHEKATSEALMGNMQMYANVCWMGRPEAQWEIKALRDGEGCGEGQHYQLNAAILKRRKPTVDQLWALLSRSSLLISQIDSC